jgi:hypothetical protein
LAASFRPPEGGERYADNVRQSSLLGGRPRPRPGAHVHDPLSRHQRDQSDLWLRAEESTGQTHTSGHEDGSYERVSSIEDERTGIHVTAGTDRVSEVPLTFDVEYW